MKHFTTVGVCIPEKHYMVDLTDRLQQIKKLVDSGKYFTINRARQYGKTTTLTALSDYLEDEYEVVSLDFQDIGGAGFTTEEDFVQAFCRLLKREIKDKLVIPIKIEHSIDDFIERKDHRAKMDELFDLLINWCTASEKPIVLMIDEVDSATNNQVFLDFLAMLRSQYLKREKKGTKDTFQSVILAGVIDVNHMKAKIREEDRHKVNSPWNIAADFLVDMSLSADGIKGMLDDYEADHKTGMDTSVTASYIWSYTSGYPFLVSRICELIDTQLVPEKLPTLSAAWTKRGVDEAVKKILAEDNTLFDSLMGKLNNYPELNTQLRDILLKGDTIGFLPDNEEQKQLRMYGLIKTQDNTIAVANKIFEMRLYQNYIGESRRNEQFREDALLNKNLFINDDHTLNMPLIMEHFAASQKRIHGEADEQFLEEEGRERFLTYISPIINGTGIYSIESQTRTQLRMDVVIHYGGHEYIVELKIWRGPRYNEDGEKQVREYLDYFGLSAGYMVSFCFNKKKDVGVVKRVPVGDKVVFEVIV